MLGRDRVLIVVVVLVLTGFTLALVAGHGPWSGPELVRVSATHGLNEGDVPVLAAWLVAMLMCARLWRRR